MKPKIIYEGGFMSGDFETLEINQPKITYLKPEDNTESVSYTHLRAHET